MKNSCGAREQIGKLLGKRRQPVVLISDQEREQGSFGVPVGKENEIELDDGNSEGSHDSGSDLGDIGVLREQGFLAKVHKAISEDALTDTTDRLNIPEPPPY